MAALGFVVAFGVAAEVLGVVLGGFLQLGVGGEGLQACLGAPVVEAV